MIETIFVIEVAAILKHEETPYCLQNEKINK